MDTLTNEAGAGPSVEIQTKRRFWLRCIWGATAGVIFPPLVGMIGTVIGMVGAFGTLAANDSGSSNVGALGDHISTMLTTTAIGFLVSMLASVFLVISLIRFFTLPKIRH